MGGGFKALLPKWGIASVGGGLKALPGRKGLVLVLVREDCQVASQANTFNLKVLICLMSGTIYWHR